MKVYLSLGSNSGNRRHNIVQACRHIESEIGTITQKSKIIKTKAWGYSDSDYLNCALEIETEMNPEILLKASDLIERKLGRTVKSFSEIDGTIKYISRPIDIDILFYGNQIIDTDTIKIPHKHLHVREFVLVPLSEIAPDFVHPVLNACVADILRNFKNLQFSTSQ